MKNLLFILLLFSIAGYSQPARIGIVASSNQGIEPPPGGETPFFIVIGQSNVGFTSVNSTNMSAKLVTDYASALNAQIYNVRDATPAWETMQGGTNTAINSYAFDEGFSIAVPFIKQYNIVDATEAYVFQYGQGGTTLASNPGNSNLDWSSTGQMWSTFDAKLSAALALAETAGKDLSLKAIIWSQGESDAENSTFADAYEANLADFFTRVQTLLTAKASTYDMPGIASGYKKIILQTYYPSASYEGTVQAAQEEYYNDNYTNTILIRSHSGYKLVDNVHYDVPTLIHQGEWAFNAYYYGTYLRQPGGYDADAATFFTAASITDTIQKIAVNTLVTGLKSDNLWDSAFQILPMVGGSASSHAVNLKSPGTYNVTWNNGGTGWTHSSTGAKPNGGEWGDVNFSPSLWTNINSNSFGVYIGSQHLYDANDIGVVSGGSYFVTAAARADGSYYYFNGNGGPSGSLTDSRGMYTNTRVGATELYGVKNNSPILSSTEITVGLPAVNFGIGADNRGGSQTNYSFREIRFEFIMKFGLVPPRAVTIYNRIQTFQHTLCRQQ